MSDFSSDFSGWARDYIPPATHFPRTPLYTKEEVESLCIGVWFKRLTLRE